MQILGYFILVFGVVGIGLGMYGLFMPSARRRGFSLSLPKLKMPGKGGGEDVDQLIAELEQSGFRNSPFESKAPAPTIVKPAQAPPLRGPGAAARARPPAPSRSVPPPFPDDEEDEPPPASLRAGYDDEEEEELDPVVAELLAEVQAAQEAAAQEAAEREALLDDGLEEAVAEEEEGEETAPEQPAAEADLLSDDMANLFAETTVVSLTSEALRDAVPEVTIEALLAQAREMRALFSDPSSRNRVA